MGINAENVPNNLTERRFRSFWERTGYWQRGSIMPDDDNDNDEKVVESGERGSLRGPLAARANASEDGARRRTGTREKGVTAHNFFYFRAAEHRPRQEPRQRGAWRGPPGGDRQPLAFIVGSIPEFPETAFGEIGRNLGFRTTGAKRYKSAKQQLVADPSLA